MGVARWGWITIQEEDPWWQVFQPYQKGSTGGLQEKTWCQAFRPYRKGSTGVGFSGVDHQSDG